MKRKLLLAITGLVFITGVGMIAYQPLFNYWIIPKLLKDSYGDNYNKVTKDDIQDNLDKLNKMSDSMFDYEGVRSVTLDDFNNVKGKLDKSQIIGLVYVPSVNVKLPVLYGTTNETMMLGAGTLKPSMKMGEGNYVLGSHSMKNKELLFTPTKDMKEGDLIYLTDKEFVYTYKTTSTGVVKPEETYVMDDSNNIKEVTLISCYDDAGTTRFIVKGVLEDKKPMAEVEESIKKELINY
ncbi:hypothetical protein COF68_05595 [Bacillus toyonensis]|uniref:class A sortase n=1 Tax=Bacillus toyonensis TaxID=155322 RepID=UPI000BFD9982|nr:class A sortase [Bacillus toyonensis]PHE64316.1 hypothetical protein COF68_05595 [Bacillus toyonensis]